MARKKTIEERREYLAKVHADCGERWEFLAPHLPPGTALNTMEPRLNTLIGMLKEWGIVTEEQVVEFEIKFAEGIQDHLINMRKEYDEQVRAAQRPKLVIPTSQETNLLKKG